MSVVAIPDKSALVWNHFSKVDSDPDGEGHHAHTGPKYDLEIRPDAMKKVENGYQVTKLTVRVSVNPTKTWVVKGKETDPLLEHERRHWMMDVLIGYEMEAAILALPPADATTLKTKITEEFEWHRTKREKWLADKYDDETKHGLDATAQAAWETKVDGWYTAKSIALKTPR